MSQIGSYAMRRSKREVKEPHKQIEIDAKRVSDKQVAEERADDKQKRSEAASKEKTRRAEERAHIQALQTESQAKLDNADASVSMMYDMGDVLGLDSNDPNFELIRAIAQQTGDNHAGLGFTTEELREVLDDPMADAAPDERKTPTPNPPDSPSSHQPDNQPAVALYYPGPQPVKPLKPPVAQLMKAASQSAPVRPAAAAALPAPPTSPPSSAHASPRPKVSARMAEPKSSSSPRNCPPDEELIAEPNRVDDELKAALAA
ncbi:hypothetical protein OPQ81_002479 [Rhizoctonia solani]|nr:hypothetical protein OPQ81_002479 [Rhizoctonia solani]